MENQNQGGQDLSQLKSMFADFQKKQTQSTGGKKSREDLLAKYFVPRNSKEIFRILPPKAGKKHIEEAFFHVVTTNAAGGKKKHGTIVYCPAHNDPKVPKRNDNGEIIKDDNGAPLLVPAPCPLCAKHKGLLAQQDPSLKGIKKENMNSNQLVIKAKNDEIYKEAIKWDAKKFYIVRGIDKGAEKDGVKFWRFKHNYKNQGTLDKLLPILEDYMTSQQADFSDPENGTDLSIIMTDSEFNGRVYKAISAITARGKSKIHHDDQIVRAWLDDDISWRDVFLPKKAPNVTPYEFLQMIADGVNPYWDDTDQSNKRWVFPGNPELEQKANTRTMNLDNNSNSNFEQASDLNPVPQTNATAQNTTYHDDATDVGKELQEQAKAAQSSVSTPVNEAVEDTSDMGDSDDYDDLPF